MGVTMVSAGIDVTVIRSLFGHVNLDTTGHYARANLQTKRQALQQVDISARPATPPRWKRDPELLTWLNCGHAKAHRLARDRVVPLTCGKLFDLGAQLALRRRRGQ